MLESQLHVAVSNRSHEPEQISQFLRDIGINDSSAVIVFLTRSVSSNYRIKWLKECVRRQLMALPLDSCLLMCQRRQQYL